MIAFGMNAGELEAAILESIRITLEILDQSVTTAELERLAKDPEIRGNALKIIQLDAVHYERVSIDNTINPFRVAENSLWITQRKPKSS